MFSAEDFREEGDFIQRFSAEILDAVNPQRMPKDTRACLEGMAEGTAGNRKLAVLFRCLSRWCGISPKKLVLLIDEVDSASNYPVFLDFLSQLRGYYLARDKKATFQSVILAGVYDIKNLKNRLTGEHKMNSPWNIAADFDIDMRLSEPGISGMLKSYETDYHTGMDVQAIAALLYDYTSGYPFLVSRLCKLMDERIAGSKGYSGRKAAWTKEGFLAAVRMLLTEENTLFESLDNKLIDYPDLKQMLKELLLGGKTIEYVPGDLGVRAAAMFGFVTIKNHIVNVSNRIFETRLYNGFLAESQRRYGLKEGADAEGSRFITGGQLDMEQVIRKFVDYYQDVFSEYNEKFLEDNGRSLFLLYIKPIINGRGNYYIEARTRNNRRTDLIIDYLGQQYIVELKIWHGEEYNKKGEKQLADYLEQYGAETGYLVSFCFNKKKKSGAEWIEVGDKKILEAVV